MSSQTGPAMARPTPTTLNEIDISSFLLSYLAT